MFDLSKKSDDIFFVYNLSPQEKYLKAKLIVNFF